MLNHFYLYATFTCSLNFLHYVEQNVKRDITLTTLHVLVITGTHHFTLGSSWCLCSEKHIFAHILLLLL